MNDVLFLVRQTRALELENCYDFDRHDSALSDMAIALDRDVGTPASEVARAVGRRLGWDVHDHELIERVADEFQLSPHVLDRIDERPRGWLAECLETFGPALTVSESRYFHRLSEVIRELGQAGRCVFVGRGATLLLPARTTLKVRLVGDMEDRIAAIRASYHVDHRGAARKIAELSRDQSRFLQTHFHAEMARPESYDLVVNTSRWSIGTCADIITQALENKREAEARQEA